MKIIPVLADGIDIPVALALGMVVLVPLLAFQVLVEAFILRSVWRQSFAELCRYTLYANINSLLAGIPTKILNAGLYGLLLPRDLPGFLARYPSAVALGSLNYFLITIAVETAYAFHWLAKNGASVRSSGIWKGVLLANLATYAILSPLHYIVTRPHPAADAFTTHTHWTRNPGTTVVFTAATGQLQTVQADGSKLQTLARGPVRDYLVSTNLNVCLFRGADRNLHLYRRDLGEEKVVWQPKDAFDMEQVAFSPSGQRVAAAEKGVFIEIVDIPTGKRLHGVFPESFGKMGEPSLAWSLDETTFYVAGFESNRVAAVSINADFSLEINRLESTNSPALLPCFGRVGRGGWRGSGDWGTYYPYDSCGDLQLRVEPGLGSGLRIYQGTESRRALMNLEIRVGILHLAGFYFGDAAFMAGCQECLFETNGYIYLLDLEHRRVGTLSPGERFVLLTERYRKKL